MVTVNPAPVDLLTVISWLMVDKYVQEDRDNIRQVQCHRRQCKDCLRSDRAREVQKTRNNTDKRGKPDGTERSLRQSRVLAQIAIIGETCVYSSIRATLSQ